MNPQDEVISIPILDKDGQIVGTHVSRWPVTNRIRLSHPVRIFVLHRPSETPDNTETWRFVEQSG